MQTTPSKKEKIFLSEAISIIARIAYPLKDPTLAKKRIRERIRYAREVGKLPLGDPLDCGTFFLWAIGKWKQLASVPGLRIAAVQGSGLGKLPALKSSGFGVVGYTDPTDLAAAFVKCETERHALQEENETLKAEVERLEIDSQARSLRDDQIRRIRRAAGRKGGRGNKL